MALSTQGSGLVWQKVKKALANASPAAQAAFQSLRVYLATQGGNPDLQFLAYSEADAIQNTGVSLGGAARVYAVYGKNDGLGDGTDSFLGLHNATDNASACLLAMVIQDDNDEVFAVKKDGWNFATDVTISCATAIGGATESAAHNGCGGFVILGA